MIGGFLFRHKGSAATVCTVHEPPSAFGDVLTRADDLTFVRDGFSWAVALAAPFALLGRGAWLAFGGYLAAVALVSMLLNALGITPAWGIVLVAVIHVILAFEAAALERWTLEQKGWKEVAVVSGQDQADCERRFFDTWLPQQPDSTGGARAGAVSQVSTIRRLFSTGS